MTRLKHSEVRIIDDAFDMKSGSVLNFSDRTMREFFDEEFSIDIDDLKYHSNGMSKAKRLRCFIATEDDFLVARVLRRLWEYREGIPQYHERPAEALAAKHRLFSLISKIEAGASVPQTDAIERFKLDETLAELVSAIQRDISANKPAVALDRLHTYCMKKFAHLLDQHSVVWDQSDPLHSRVGKYIKALEREHELREISVRIMKSSISIFEKFNDIRNMGSLAHDNVLVNPAEARYIFEAITNLLRFLKEVEAARFGA